MRPSLLKISTLAGDDLTKGLDLPDIMQETIAKIVEQDSKRRADLIVYRLKQIGVTLDLEEEQRKRFKSLTKEIENGEETIYYNDGTEEGLRLITFVTTETDFDPENCSLGCTTSYY